MASAALLAGLAAGAATPTIVNDVRLWSGPEGTRLVLDLSAPRNTRCSRSRIRIAS